MIRSIVIESTKFKIHCGRPSSVHLHNDCHAIALLSQGAPFIGSGCNIIQSLRLHLSGHFGCRVHSCIHNNICSTNSQPLHHSAARCTSCIIIIIVFFDRSIDIRGGFYVRRRIGNTSHHGTISNPNRKPQHCHSHRRRECPRQDKLRIRPCRFAR